MTLRKIAAVVILVIIALSCSKEEKSDRLSALVEGRITVADSLDSSGDYSNIELLSTIRLDSETVDTLFFALTDSSGDFSGVASFEKNDIYPLIVRRNQNNFGLFNLIFADGDTINISGELPGIQQTIEINSPEHEVYETFNRVERGFNRVAGFINAGAVSADSVQIEIEKWSNIYWQIFEEHPGTYAAKLAGETSATILSGLNDSLMVDRSNKVLNEYNSLSAGARSALAEYYGETGGLTAILDFYKRIESKNITEPDKIELKMSRIELLYDSSRTNQAQQLLNELKTEYPENNFVQEWSENMAYDLEFLSPGSPFPDLQFQLTDGDSISTEALSGKPFLIEITRFDNALYQQQYERTVAIYQIYRNFDLEIITVPIASNNVILEAFFQERNRIWKIAAPNSFDTEELIETLNLTRVPTRFLVNTDGTIIGRYIGTEYDDIVEGLQKIITLTE